VDELEALLRPLGLHRQKARQLVRFSWQYLGEWWDDIGELAGVGAYVREAVGLVCFSYTDLSCGDRALTEYADEVRRTESLPGRRD
jgi:endonuclease III